MSGPTVTPEQPQSASTALAKAAKHERRAQLADALDLSAEELVFLHRQLAVAASGLDGRVDRRELTARRLSISPGELIVLRTAIAQDDRSKRIRVRPIARRVIGLAPLRLSLDGRAPQPRAAITTGAPVTRRQAGYRRVRGEDWNGDTNVFVTDWGDKVHLYADCRGLRGFRTAGEPDPDVHQARLRDPVCRDRGGCGWCFGNWSPWDIDRLDKVIEALHGGRSDRAVRPSRLLPEDRARRATSRRRPVPDELELERQQQIRFEAWWLR